MKVEIKKLGRSRFVSFYGYGNQPEETAMTKMFKWCENRKIDLAKGELNVFGFNNPNPVEGATDYGYEFWVSVDKNEKPEEDIRIIEFMGGTYATKVCSGAESIFKSWQELIAWCKENNMKFGYHQPLEKIIGNISDVQNIVVEIYLPVILDD